jgi:hypothetical protein
LYAFVFLINSFPLINKMENSQNSFSVPRWIMKMGCFRFGIYTWVGICISAIFDLDCPAGLGIFRGNCPLLTLGGSKVSIKGNFKGKVRK